MVEEARLEQLESGRAAVTEGWFVVNVKDAAWLTNDVFGAACVFESDPRVVRGRDDLEPRRFPQLGFALKVLWPGQPSGMYHRESNQEDFLVLAGECLLLVEGEERSLQAWDFVHCPPDTEHAFMATGESPCVIFMIGARTKEKQIVYPRSEIARQYGAGVESQTSAASVAYARFPHWQPGRPDGWDELPWA